MLLENNTGVCPFCKLGTAFSLRRQIAYASPHYYGEDRSKVLGPPNDIQHTGVLIYECQHCRKSVVLLETIIREVPGTRPETRSRRMVVPLPSARDLPPAVPEAIASFFREASECENVGAYRGAAVLYRAAVEELVKDRGAQGRDLFQKIEYIKDDLSEGLADDFHEARMLGNDSIHDGLAYSQDEVADVATLIEEAVVTLYLQPEERRAMREARRERRDRLKSGQSSEQMSSDPT